MSDFNDIGISRAPDTARIKKLLLIGLFASALHFIGDMILGWGVEDETKTGILRMLSAYTGTSDGGIFTAAVLGMLGMVLEGLAYFGIYRMTAPYSPKGAHSLRAGIFGYLMFGACSYLCPRISDKARPCRRACCKVCRILSAACVCAVLDILCRSGGGADQSLCQGADSLPEMVLGIFAACRNACSRAARRYR